MGVASRARRCRRDVHSRSVLKIKQKKVVLKASKNCPPFSSSSFLLPPSLSFFPTFLFFPPPLPFSLFCGERHKGQAGAPAPCLCQKNARARALPAPSPRPPHTPWQLKCGLEPFGFVARAVISMFRAIGNAQHPLVVQHMVLAM